MPGSAVAVRTDQRRDQPVRHRHAADAAHRAHARADGRGSVADLTSARSRTSALAGRRRSSRRSRSKPPAAGAPAPAPGAGSRRRKPFPACRARWRTRRGACRRPNPPDAAGYVAGADADAVAGAASPRCPDCQPRVQARRPLRRRRAEPPVAALPPTGAGRRRRDDPNAPPRPPWRRRPPATAAQIIITPPGTEFRVAGGPYTVPVSINNASRVSTLTLTVTFNPTVLRVRTVQDGTFMRQGGVTASLHAAHRRGGGPRRHRHHAHRRSDRRVRRRDCSPRCCSTPSVPATR